MLGLVVLAGVLTTMLVVGLIVATLAVPVSRLLAIATPIVDGVLIVLGLLLLAGRNPFERLPGVRVPGVVNPFGRAFAYGVLLGPIALPCAGPFLVALLAISVGLTDTLSRIGTFLLFGFGFGLPLVVLSLLAGARAQAVVRWIVARHRAVELVAGLVLIGAAILDLADKWDVIASGLGLR